MMEVLFILDINKKIADFLEIKKKSVEFKKSIYSK